MYRNRIWKQISLSVRILSSESVKLLSSVSASAQAGVETHPNNVPSIIITVQWYHFTPLQTSNFNLINSDWHKTKEWDNCRGGVTRQNPWSSTLVILVSISLEHIFVICYYCYSSMGLCSQKWLITTLIYTIEWKNSLIHMSVIYCMLSLICYHYSVVWSRNQCPVTQDLSVQGRWIDLCTSAWKQLSKYRQINNFMLELLFKWALFS